MKKPCKKCKNCAIHNNTKVGKNVDFTSICDRACSYCYVTAARENGFNAKKRVEKYEYTGEILRMRPATIEKLNLCEGIRFFSFADYQSWMDEQISQVILDCQARGLKMKAITKKPEFIEKFAEYFEVIHISVDNTGDGVDWHTALELRETYPNVKIRAVICRDIDIDALEPWVDILTFNHSRNGYKRYKPADRANYAQMFPGKVCCQTGKCISCPIKCGLAQ